MIKKVIISIILSVISIIRIFADPMETWKASQSVQSAIKKLKTLKDDPEKVDELWEVLWEEIGESLWSKVLEKETQANGLEKLKQFHEYLFIELELQYKPMYDEICKVLDQLKEFVDKAENALEVGFCDTLNGVYLEIRWLDIWPNGDPIVEETIEKLKALKAQISKIGVTDDAKAVVENLLKKTIVRCFSEDVLIPIIQNKEKTIKEKRELCFEALKRFYRYLFSVLGLEYCDNYDEIGNRLVQEEESGEISLYDFVREFEIKLENMIEVVNSEIIKLAPIDSTLEEGSRDNQQVKS